MKEATLVVTRLLLTYKRLVGDVFFLSGGL